MKSLLAIDPGIELGWAFWNPKRKFPCRAGIIKPDNRCKKDFFVRVHNVVWQLGKVINVFSPQIVAVEWPSYFGSSLGGKVVAQSGSLVKLSFIVGSIHTMVNAFEYEFLPIEVPKWKGQLVKRIVEKRIKRIIPESRLELLQLKSHMFDAVGIGLYVRGLF